MHWLKYVKNRRHLIAAFCCFAIFFDFSRAYSQESSVLSSGNWYKIAIVQTGVYQIDYNLLREMGVDMSSIAPDRIQIYGNGSGMLPQRNDVPRPHDLIQNAILVKGEADGRFDVNDQIYFYAEGPTVIGYDSSKTNLFHQTNIYSDTTYYFLTVGESKGLRIKNQASISNGKGVPITQFDDYWYHEQELVNLLRSGREWWGEYLATSSPLTLQVNLPDIIPSSVVTMSTSAVAAAYAPTRFLWQLNGQNVGETKMAAVVRNQYDLYGTYDMKGVRAESSFKSQSNVSPTGAITIGASFDKGGESSAQAYLNYVALQVKRELRPGSEQQLYYFLPVATDTISYQIRNVVAGWQWWNVTERLSPSVAMIGTDGFFIEKSGKGFRKYVGFGDAKAYKPVSWQRVPNQDIRSKASPDLLVITSNAYLKEAERLAGFRKEHDKLDVQVATVDQIYNEFAGGMTDLTALRDYIRLVYTKVPGKLKYVLLFGDATYDYRNKLQNQSQIQRNSWVPVYESRESLNQVQTYSSDDYLGFLDDADGEWVESNAGDHHLQIGIGRLPVKSGLEARVVVDKLINYESSKTTYGPWRNTIQFVADDGDGGDHQRHADNLARLIQKELLPGRIFLDAYPQNTTEYGQKAPAVNKAILKCISDGTLILNYTGHGGTSGWAEEQVLTVSEMQSARGYNNLPLLLTATCDFGRFDDPGLVSGGELMVQSPKGGAIGALATTRPVFSSTNFLINKAFYDAMIALGPGARLGDLMKLTKNKSLEGSSNRNFTLLGDPSMQLARGQQQIRWVENPDTLRALQKVSLKGAIYKTGEQLPDQSFSGTARITVYDKQVGFKTLGDNQGSVTEYSEFRSRLFDGNVIVNGGKFTCEFIMPKDIDYRVGIGRASIYAVRSDSLSDAGGQLDLIVGGGSTFNEDKLPPRVAGYMNNNNFKSGDLISESSVLILKLSDESGINISKAGIGHNIVLTLNDTLDIVLNDYYVADPDKYNSGTILYPFENLRQGKYTVRIKVWDTYNNSSEISFGFQVGAAKGIQLTALNVYPNPFDQEFSFELNHSRGNEDIEVVLNIFLKSGQRLSAFKWQYYNSESIIKETVPSLHLKPLNMPGYQYIYSLEIRSLKDNSVDRRSGKLSRLP